MRLPPEDKDAVFVATNQLGAVFLDDFFSCVGFFPFFKANWPKFFLSKRWLFFSSVPVIDSLEILPFISSRSAQLSVLPVIVDAFEESNLW